MKKRVLQLLFFMMVGGSFTACNARSDQESLINTEIETSTEDSEEIPMEKSTKESTDTSTQPISTTVLPLPNTTDINNLNDCTIAVSLDEGDVYVDDSGIMQMKVTVYVYDFYDMVDLSLLKEGDMIHIRQQDIQITSLEWNENGFVIINGGLDNGGYELRSNEGGVFFESNYSDAKSYYAIGETVLPVSPDFKYTDSSDLDKEPVIYDSEDFLIENDIDYHFTPHNTSLIIKNGNVVDMNRIYMP